MIASLDVLDAVFDDLVEKGDYDGHPFRGNQWTDASGASRGGVKDVVGPRTVDDIVTRADLIKFAEMPPAFVGDTELFTHATGSRGGLESILVQGIKPKYESGTVYSSRPPLIRDLGLGYVIFKADKGVAVKGEDIVEIGLSYDEYKFNKTIPPSDIVKVVGTYVFNAGGQNIREDYLADFILKNPDDPQIAGLPEKYKRWATLARDVSKGDYVGHPFRGNQWTDASGAGRGGAGADVGADLGPLHLRGVATVEEAIAQGRPLAMLRPETYSPKLRELVDANTKARDLLGKITAEAKADGSDGTSVFGDPRYAVLETILILTSVEAGRQIALEYALALGFETVAEPPRSRYGTILSEEFGYEEHSRNEDGRLVRTEERIDANYAVNSGAVLNSSLGRTVLLEKSDDGKVTVRFARIGPDASSPTRSPKYEYGDEVDLATLMGVKFFKETVDTDTSVDRDTSAFSLARSEQAGVLGRELVRQAAQELGITMPTFRPPVHVTAAPLAEKLNAQGELDVKGRIGTMLAHVEDVARKFTMFSTAVSPEAAVRRSDSGNIKPAMLAQQAADLPPDTKVSVTVPANRVAAILKDGRLKTQFETGTSKGLNLPRVREDMEALMFGRPQGTNPAMRPIYGMMESGGVTLPSSLRGNEQYGTVTLVLKDSVRERTTFTEGDSLNRQGDPVPAGDSDKTLSALNFGSRAEFDQRAVTRSESAKRSSGYYEAQIHGGVATSDIERVIIDTTVYKDFGYETVQPSPSLIKALNKAGIPFEIRAGEQIDEKVGKARAVRFDMSVVIKGDYVGHPFRGNQWTDASGSGREGTSATPAGTPTKQLLTGVREYRIHLSEYDKDRWVPTLFVDGKPTTIQGQVSHFTKDKAEQGLAKFERATEAMLGAAVKVADTDGGQRPLTELTFTSAAGRVSTRRVGWAEEGRTEALEAYTRDSVALNMALRRGETTDGPLDAYMESGNQGTVYRSIANTNGVAGRLFSELTDGQMIVDRGYSSTSRSVNIAAEMDAAGDGLILQIQMPSGSSRLAVPRGVFFGGDQEEVILPRGSGFRFVRQAESVDGRAMLVVELVEAAELVEKGDFVGHPFRGNQWMGADGVSRLGAESSPDQDRRAYEMRQEGKTWEDIAKELGYANGGAVRRLAIRHEARLKEGTEGKPPTPEKPTPQETDTKGGAITSLADPTSVRAARRMIKDLVGDVGVLQAVKDAAGDATRLTAVPLTDDEKALAKGVEEIGVLLTKAIEAEVVATRGGSAEESRILAQAESDLFRAIERLDDLRDSIGGDLDAALRKTLTGTTAGVFGRFKLAAGTLSATVAAANLLIKENEPTGVVKFDSQTLLGQAEAAGLDPNDLYGASSSYTQEQALIASAVSGAAIRVRQVLTGRAQTVGVIGKGSDELAAEIKVNESAVRSAELGDALAVREDAMEVANAIAQKVQNGDLTSEQVGRLTDKQIVDLTMREFFVGTRPLEVRAPTDRVSGVRDNYRGTETDVLKNGEEIKRSQTAQEMTFAVLSPQVRQALLVQIVREGLATPAVQRNAELLDNVRSPEVRSGDRILVPEGSTYRQLTEVRSELLSDRGQSESERIAARQSATVRVLEAAGVKFAKPKDVTVNVVSEARGRSGLADKTRVAYTEMVNSVIPFLPAALVDGSMSAPIVGRFTGGGKLEISAVAGSGVRRAHAENGGRGKVIIRQPAPTIKEGKLRRHDRSVMLHEIGHGLEYANPWIRAIEYVTWQERRGSERIRTLNSITGGSGYRSDEKGVQDEWRNNYAGKTYGGQRTSTYEIFTTGLQSIWFDDQAADPKHKAIVLGILALAGARP